MKRITATILLLVALFSTMVFAEEAVTNPPTVPAAERALPAQPAPEAAGASETPTMDTGDTAWMIVATALVMLMTLPGLALFYGGLAKRKDTLNTMAMSFVKLEEEISRSASLTERPRPGVNPARLSNPLFMLRRSNMDLHPLILLWMHLSFIGSRAQRNLGNPKISGINFMARSGSGRHWKNRSMLRLSSS